MTTPDMYLRSTAFGSETLPSGLPSIQETASVGITSSPPVYDSPHLSNSSTARSKDCSLSDTFSSTTSTVASPLGSTIPASLVLEGGYNNTSDENNHALHNTDYSESSNFPIENPSGLRGASLSSPEPKPRLDDSDQHFFPSHTEERPNERIEPQREDFNLPVSGGALQLSGDVRSNVKTKQEFPEASTSCQNQGCVPAPTPVPADSACPTAADTLNEPSHSEGRGPTNSENFEGTNTTQNSSQSCENTAPSAFDSDNIGAANSASCEPRSVQASHNLLRQVLLVALHNLYHVGTLCDYQSGCDQNCEPSKKSLFSAGNSAENDEQTEACPDSQCAIGSAECYNYHKQVIECGTAGIESLYPYLTIFGPCLLSRVVPSTQHYAVRTYMYNQLMLLRNPYLPQTVVALNEQRSSWDHNPEAFFDSHADDALGLHSGSGDSDCRQNSEQTINNCMEDIARHQYRRDSSREFLASFQQLSPDHYLLHTAGSGSNTTNLRRDDCDNSRPITGPESGALSTRRTPRRGNNGAPSIQGGQGHSPNSSGNDDFPSNPERSNVRLPMRIRKSTPRDSSGAMRNGRGVKEGSDKAERPCDLDITPTTSSSPTTFSISDELRYDEDMLRVTIGNNKQTANRDCFVNGCPPSTNVKCDVPGVQWISTYQYWRARWTDKRTNEPTSRYFSSKRYGFEQAQQLAISARLSAETEGVARVKTSSNDDDDTNNTMSSINNEFEDEEDALEEDEILKQIELHSPIDDTLGKSGPIRDNTLSTLGTRCNEPCESNMYFGQDACLSEHERSAALIHNSSRENAPIEGMSTHGLPTMATSSMTKRLSREAYNMPRTCLDVKNQTDSYQNGQIRDSFYGSSDQLDKQKDISKSPYFFHGNDSKSESRPLFAPGGSFMKNPEDGHRMSSPYNDYSDGVSHMTPNTVGGGYDYAATNGNSINALMELQEPTLNGGTTSWVSLSTTSKNSLSSSSRRTASPSSNASKPAQGNNADTKTVSEASICSFKSNRHMKKEHSRGDKKVGRRPESPPHSNSTTSKRRRQQNLQMSGSSMMTPPIPADAVQGGHNNLGILISGRVNNNSDSNLSGTGIASQGRAPEWKKDYRCWQVALTDSSGCKWLYFFSAKKHGIDKAREMAFACQRTGIPKGAVQLSTIQKLHATRRIKSQMKGSTPNVSSQDRAGRLSTYHVNYESGQPLYDSTMSTPKDERMQDGSLGRIYESSQQSFTTPVYHNIPSNPVSPYINS